MAAETVELWVMVAPAETLTPELARVWLATDGDGFMSWMWLAHHAMRTDDEVVRQAAESLMGDLVSMVAACAAVMGSGEPLRLEDRSTGRFIAPEEQTRGRTALLACASGVEWDEAFPVASAVRALGARLLAEPPRTGVAEPRAATDLRGREGS